MNARPRAPDNRVGTFSRSLSIPWSYTTTSNGKTYHSKSTRVTALWFKTPSVRGEMLPSGFRKPTDYARAIAVFDKGFAYSGAVFAGCNSQKASWIYEGTDGRAHTGMATIGINWPSMQVVIDPDLVNRAITEALGKVQNQRVNLGEALGESLSTLNMIEDRMQRLRKGWVALKKRRFKDVVEHLIGEKVLTATRTSRSVVVFSHTDSKGKVTTRSKRAWTTHLHKRYKTNLNGLYLEYIYGWLPLMSDIYNGIDQLTRGFRDREQVFSVVREVRDVLPQGAFVGPQGGWTTFQGGSASQSCKVKLWGRVTSPLHNFTALGLTNPLSVAWALLGFSFVVDWMIPIGDWLDHLTASLGVQFVAGCRTDIVQANVPVVRRNIYCSNRSTKDAWYHGYPAATVRVFAMQRRTYGDWPWALPYMKNPLSLQHVINAVALWRSVRK